jgi:hypothetical protein
LTFARFGVEQEWLCIYVFDCVTCVNDPFFSLSDEMQTVMMNRMDDKELEKKVESDVVESDQEVRRDF